MTSTSERSALDAAMDLVMQKLERRMEMTSRLRVAGERGTNAAEIERMERQVGGATMILENAISLYNQELVRCVQHGGLVP